MDRHIIHPTMVTLELSRAERPGNILIILSNSLNVGPPCPIARGDLALTSTHRLRRSIQTRCTIGPATALQHQAGAHQEYHLTPVALSTTLGNQAHRDTLLPLVFLRRGCPILLGLLTVSISKASSTLEMPISPLAHQEDTTEESIMTITLLLLQIRSFGDSFADIPLQTNSTQPILACNVALLTHRAGPNPAISNTTHSSHPNAVLKCSFLILLAGRAILPTFTSTPIDLIPSNSSRNMVTTEVVVHALLEGWDSITRPDRSRITATNLPIGVSEILDSNVAPVASGKEDKDPEREEPARTSAILGNAESETLERQINNMTSMTREKETNQEAMSET